MNQDTNEPTGLSKLPDSGSANREWDASSQQAVVDVAIKVGRGLPMTPQEIKFRDQILSGDESILGGTGLKAQQIYHTYLLANQPVLSPQQKDMFLKGELTEPERIQIVDELALKSGRTSFLDETEQAVIDHIRPGQPGHQAALYDRFLQSMHSHLLANVDPEKEQFIYQTASWEKPVTIQNPSPEPIQTISPFGYSVGKLEDPEQLSDATMRGNQTMDWRFNPVDHATPLSSYGGSEVEALKIYQQLQALEYELLLPAEVEHIRQYLQNDGYLSDQEITAALYDASLTQQELSHRVDVLARPDTPPDVKEHIVDYLWDIHQTVRDHPLLAGLDEKTSYELLSIEHRPQSEDIATHLHKAAQQSEETTVSELKQNNEEGFIRTLLRLKTLEGGMLANFLHNYALVGQLMDKLIQSETLTVKTETPKHMEKPELAPRFDWKQIAEDASRLGLTKEALEKSGNLNDLLNGRRTGVLQLEQNDGAGTLTPISGKLYVTEVPSEGPRLFLQPEQESIKLPKTFLGHELSDEDRKNLLSSREMGRVVELKDKVTGDPFKAYVGLDPEVNKLTVLRQDRFHIPSTIKGVELTPQQKTDLKDGKSIALNGMMGVDGKPFDGSVRISAVKRSLQFKRAPQQALSQSNQQQADPTASARLQAQDKPQAQPTKEAKQQQSDATAKQKAMNSQKADSAQKVAVVTKNGQTRTTVDTNKGATTQTKGKEIKAGQKSKETSVNGKAIKENLTQARPQSKKAKKGLKQ